MPGPMFYLRPHLYENTAALRKQKTDLECRIAETERLQSHPKREQIENLFSMLCDVEELRRKGVRSGDGVFNHIDSFFDRFMRSVVSGFVLSILICVMNIGSTAVLEPRHLGYLWACAGFIMFCTFSLLDHVNRRLYKEDVKKIKVLFQENPELLPILKTKTWIPDEIANSNQGESHV